MTSNLAPKLNTSIFILTLCQGLSTTVISLVSTSTAVAAANLLENKSLATLPTSIQFVGMMFSTSAASFLMKKTSRRVGFTFGALILVLAGTLSCLALYSKNFPLFCLGSFFVGSFNAFALLYRFAAAEIVSEEIRSKAISIVMSGGLFAAFLGPALASQAKDFLPDYSFFGSYAIIVILGLCSAVAMQFVKIPKQEVSLQPSPSRPLKEILMQPKFVVGWVGGTVGYMVMTVLMTSAPLAMKDCGFHFHDTAFIMQWHVFGMFAPSLVLGAFMKKYGTLEVMFVGVIMMVECVLINLFGQSMTHFWFGLFALGIGWCCLFVGGTNFLTFTYAPGEKAKVQAFNDTTMLSFVAGASLSAGFIQNNLGWKFLNYAVLPFLLVTAVLLIRLLLRPNRAP